MSVRKLYLLGLFGAAVLGLILQDEDRTAVQTPAPARVATPNSAPAPAPAESRTGLVEEDKRAALTAPASARVLVVTGSRVNARAAPSLNGQILTSLARGQKVSALTDRGGWTEITLPDGSGRTAWMATRYLAASLPPKPATTAAPAPSASAASPRPPRARSRRPGRT